MVGVGMSEPGAVIVHPNRDKASSKLTRGLVLLLLLASIVLLALISYGGWDELVGARALEPIWIVVYAVIAFFVLRWNRGVLPFGAALGLMLGIFATISVPGWFVRDRTGYHASTLSPDLIGVLTVVLVAVQVMLIAFAMRGFQQEWNVELETVPGEAVGPLPG
jgi:hypothetical protein